ncbi:MAG: hypothetical protein AAGK02_08125 [Pseudomonadota bacterium]
MKKLLSATLAAGAATMLAIPVSAQDDAGDKVNMVIVYDEDECPEATDDNEIVVCEILVQSERYRIPSNLRTSTSPENTSWSRRVETLKLIGNFGTLSCTPKGAGGVTGCTQQMIEAAYADRDASSQVRFAQLIEQARAERLSTIDVDAAAEQERVEQIEREYLERLERERSAPLPGEEAALPAPVPVEPGIEQPDEEETPEG